MLTFRIVSVNQLEPNHPELNNKFEELRNYSVLTHGYSGAMGTMRDMLLLKGLDFALNESDANLNISLGVLDGFEVVKYGTEIVVATIDFEIIDNQ